MHLIWYTLHGMWDVGWLLQVTVAFYALLLMEYKMYVVTSSKMMESECVLWHMNKCIQANWTFETLFKWDILWKLLDAFHVVIFMLEIYRYVYVSIGAHTIWLHSLRYTIQYHSDNKMDNFFRRLNVATCVQSICQ